nr:pentatricopeptide repeat-containing protein At4g31070, mitochondrial [Tanacetum cinerariifolium]
KSVFLLSALVDLYWRAGDSVMVFRIFDDMEDRNEVSWTTMIVGYVGICDYVMALDCYRRMQNEGVQANYVTVLPLLTVGTKIAVKTFTLRWVRNGKLTYPEQEKEEFEEARKELQRELEKGTSLDDLRKKMT